MCVVRTRNAQAGVNVFRSWGLLNHTMSMGKHTRHANTTYTLSTPVSSYLDLTARATRVGRTRKGHR